MVYSVSRKGAQYAVVDSDNNFIDDETGKKAEMQAKADRLNAEQEEQAQNDTNSVNDSDSSNTGINSTGENEEQTEQVNSDSGLEQTSEDDTRARAPFVAKDKATDQGVKDESIKQEAAKGNANRTQASKRFVLVKGKGWLYQ